MSQTIVIDLGAPVAVRCPLAFWLEHGPALARHLAVTGVEITDAPDPQPFGWWTVPISWRGVGLPACIAWHLPDQNTRRYGTRPEALEAFNAAALVWAQSVAAKEGR